MDIEKIKFQISEVMKDTKEDGQYTVLATHGQIKGTAYPVLSIVLRRGKPSLLVHSGHVPYASAVTNAPAGLAAIARAEACGFDTTPWTKKASDDDRYDEFEALERLADEHYAENHRA